MGKRSAEMKPMPEFIEMIGPYMYADGNVSSGELGAANSPQHPIPNVIECFLFFLQYFQGIWHTHQRFKFP